MSLHAFADECKAHGYRLAVAVVETRELDQLRKVIRDVMLPGQRRPHMCRENDKQRKRIIKALTCAGTCVTIYDTSEVRDRPRRDVALERLVDDLAKMGANRLVLERDDSVYDSDRKVIRERSLVAGCQGILGYEHMRAYEELLLAIPDAVAWCVQKGGGWKDKAAPLISEVITLP
jgi:hypothetical protein